MIKKILFSALVLNMGLLLGRMSGFLREAIVAATYGVSIQSDIVVLMLTVPDLLVSILAGGAMGAVLTPEFSSNSKSSNKLLIQALVFFGCIFLLVSGGLYWYSYALAEFFAPGLSEVQIFEVSIALEWVIWLMPLTVLAGIMTAFLHFKNKFFIASLGTLILNSSIIVGLLLVFLGYGSLVWVAVFVLIGGLLRLVSQIISAKISLDVPYLFKPLLVNKRILWHFVQALGSGGMLMLIPIFARTISSYFGEGSIAIMNYTTKLIDFPLAVAITIFSVVLFPRLSASFLTNFKLHCKLAGNGFKVILGLSLLLTITLIMHRYAYVNIVFNHGNMNSVDLHKIQELLLIGLISLPLQGLSMYFTSIFFSQKNTIKPFLINGLALILFLLCYKLNIFENGLESIMWGMVMSYGFSCILQMFFLQKNHMKLVVGNITMNFIIGVTLSVSTLYIMNLALIELNLHHVTSLLISIIIGILASIVLIIFDDQARVLIKNFMRKNEKNT
jgi:putative peptidoglycan lipid II flippase